MNYYLDANGQICGGDRQQRADGSFDPEIPDRPGADYRWDGSAWVQMAPVIATQNYVALYNDLLTEGLNVFLFVRSISDQNLPIANAYGDFVNALTTPAPSLSSLQSCINNLFAAIQGFDLAFSDTQITTMRLLLDRNGFSAIAFPLGDGV